MVAHF